MFPSRICAAAAVALTALADPTGAKAALDGCNKTAEQVYIAIAHSSEEGWISLGWWLVEPQACVTMIPGDLPNRYYYTYAESDSGRSWGGGYNFCVQDDKFDILGADNCESRGYDTVGFSEHDVGGRTNHTVLFGP